MPHTWVENNVALFNGNGVAGAAERHRNCSPIYGGANETLERMTREVAFKERRSPLAECVHVISVVRQVFDAAYRGNAKWYLGERRQWQSRHPRKAARLAVQRRDPLQRGYEWLAAAAGAAAEDGANEGEHRPHFHLGGGGQKNTARHRDW